MKECYICQTELKRSDKTVWTYCPICKEFRLTGRGPKENKEEVV